MPWKTGQEARSSLKSGQEQDKKLMNTRFSQVSYVPSRSSFPPDRVSESKTREVDSKCKGFSHSSRMIVQALSHSRIRQEAERLMRKYENQSHALDREGFRKVLRDLDPNGREALPSNFE